MAGVPPFVLLHRQQPTYIRIIVRKVAHEKVSGRGILANQLTSDKVSDEDHVIEGNE